MRPPMPQELHSQVLVLSMCAIAKTHQPALGHLREQEQNLLHLLAQPALLFRQVNRNPLHSSPFALLSTQPRYDPVRRTLDAAEVKRCESSRCHAFMLHDSLW